GMNDVRGRELDLDRFEIEATPRFPAVAPKQGRQLPGAEEGRCERSFLHGHSSLLETNWMSRHRLWSSLTSTLNDSGTPGSGGLSPFTMASYTRERPGTSSDFTVSIS